MKLLILACLVAVACCSINNDIIPGEYMVLLNKNVVPESQVHVFAEKLRKRFNVDVARTFSGFRMLHIKAKYIDPAVLQELPEVKLVEPNMLHRIQQCACTAHPGCFGGDRIDQRGPLSYNDFRAPAGEYCHDAGTDGAGVVVYVADTGIDFAHIDFGGRASWGWAADGLTFGDQHGHGTHCAGSVMSNTYGMAKAATSVAVKVLNDRGIGSTGDIVAGLEWIAGQSTSPTPNAVISMSIGGGANTIIDNAVNECIAAGYSVSVAAGNSGADACDESPARVPNAVTVGAMDINDVCATFSNTGTCMNIFAPGVNIQSLATGGGSSTMSGTSMACPHVSGIMARMISGMGSPTPADVRDALYAAATAGVINGIPTLPTGTPNEMVFISC